MWDNLRPDSASGIRLFAGAESVRDSPAAFRIEPAQELPCPLGLPHLFWPRVTQLPTDPGTNSFST